MSNFHPWDCSCADCQPRVPGERRGLNPWLHFAGIVVIAFIFLGVAMLVTGGR